MGLKARARAGLARLAAGAPARVFLLVGAGGREAAEQLRLDPRLAVLDSPRSANVLLAVGGAVAGLLRPALAVHDQASRPRATVWWPVGERAARLARLSGLFPAASVVGPDDDPAEVAVRRERELLAGARPSEPEVLPDEEPAEWRGVGPHGQGGEGMMGGVPYGRPMAMRAPDRDGLELDRLPLRLGPFFPHLPPGLVLEVKLQGDVFQQVALGRDPFARRARRSPGRLPAAWRDPFAAALHRPVPVATLELARARHHLRWLAGALRFHGLPGLGERMLRLALGLGEADPDQGLHSLRRLERLLRRTQALRAATRRVGRLDRRDRPDRPGRADLEGLGPVARASGRAGDLRGELPAYRDLGFEPVAAEGDGDAWSRLVQRLGEAEQALELVVRCREAGGGAADRGSDGGDGGPAVGPLAAVEAPRGRLAPGEPPPGARLLALAPGALTGLEWGDALATLVSLDLDLEEAALPPRAAAAPVPDEGFAAAGQPEADGEGGEAGETEADGEEEAA